MSDRVMKDWVFWTLLGGAALAMLWGVLDAAL